MTLERLWSSLDQVVQPAFDSFSFAPLSPQLREDPTIKRLDLDEDRVFFYLDSVNVLFKYLEELKTFLGLQIF